MSTQPDTLRKYGTDRVVGPGVFDNLPREEPPYGHKYVKFTQYIPPDGRKKSIYTALADAIADRAQEFVTNGFSFATEVLSTGQCVLYICDDENDGQDVAIRVCANGPAVVANIEHMLQNTDIDKALEARKADKEGYEDE